ncbi:MAG: isoleucine--tRNA ligase [Candidatus Marinimicrobia bacterium]|nr:isoleucine--tRNA ligase [Candidatus Neomarinimicrobiota bacterium]|tara:strand:- start:711 stop:4016 length:3306 start_codon:yes stop_codon:yes gene_type:complete
MSNESKVKYKFKPVPKNVSFVDIEHQIIAQWEKNKTFKRLVEKNKGKKPWSFMDGPITANNPMGVHHAWGRTLKDIFQRFHALNGYDMRYQNGFDCQGLWVEVEVEKSMGFETKRDIEKYGLEKFVNECKSRVKKYSEIQTEQSKRLGYWMDWDNSYYTMSDENNYTIWSFLKKLFEKGKIYKGYDVVPWSGRSGTSYSQMEIIEGRKLVAHTSVFVRFPLKNREKEYLLVWTTTPWTLTSNISAAINVNIDYVKLKASDGSIYYFAKDNLKFQRLEKQFKDKKMWIEGVPKLKTIEQIFNERGGYTIIDTFKGKKLVGLEYKGPFDNLPAQNSLGGYPNINEKLKSKNINAIKCHRVIDGGKDSIGKDVVVAGEGTGIVHIATGCGAIDNKIGRNENLVEIAPIDDEAKYIEGFGFLTGKIATDETTKDVILDYLKQNEYLVYSEQYPHVYPHCWRSGDELVYKMVDEWYIKMDWRDEIKSIVSDINWIPDWGHDREIEWLDNMGDWMISKKRFWGLALPIWTFEDGSFYVVGSKKELKELCVDGWDEFEGNSPHRPWIDRIKIKHPETGLVGTRIPDVGNPWLDAGIVPFSTLDYNKNRDYWKKWFPADFVVECFPGQFRNWFYSLLAMSTIMEKKAPFKNLLGHALVKDENGRDMHKSWGNAIWFEDAAEKMGVDVMRWLYASQNPERNLLFGYSVADGVRKKIITLWNTYSFFITYANLDQFDIGKKLDYQEGFTKLDNWILAKINNFSIRANDLYKDFKVYILMEEASVFLDDLSNWYVRRNRRRFWKSESDIDKDAAYFCLHTTLVKYLQIISPVIPFLSDYMYQNLMNNKKSIHLSDYPLANKDDVNQGLIEEIDTVIEVVSLARSARNKANIKVRQPLSEVVVFVVDDCFKKHLIENKEDIKQELNVKDLRFADSYNEFMSIKIKPNFQTLGAKFNKSMKEVLSDINKLSLEELSDIVSSKDSNYKLDNGDIIDYTDFIIEQNPKNGFEVSSNNLFKIGINTNITNELEQEGIVRDLIRHVQNFRKESDLDVSDRISISLSYNKDLEHALKNHKKYFMNEVLGVNISFNQDSLDFNKDIDIIGEKIKLSIAKE